MLDFLSSPVLFPSDMDSPKLSAGATFKLPETMNWTDYDYYNTMMDKSLASLTDLTKLEPINENSMHVYAPFILDDTSKLNKAVFMNDDSKRMALLELAQSMAQAYSLPFYSTPNGDNNDTAEQRKLLRANLRGALDVVEQDMQRNGHDSLYRGNNDMTCTPCISEQWSWQEEIVDVPDLVHSVCSSPSVHSLADDHHPPTPVLLESGISYAENDGAGEQSTVRSLVAPSLHQDQSFYDKKKIRPIKKWMNKMKQAKQDCGKAISSTSRKLCHWIKK